MPWCDLTCILHSCILSQIVPYMKFTKLQSRHNAPSKDTQHHIAVIAQSGVLSGS